MYCSRSYPEKLTDSETALFPNAAFVRSGSSEQTRMREALKKQACAAVSDKAYKVLDILLFKYLNRSNGCCCPFQGTLAKDAGCSSRTIKRAVEDLRENQLVFTRRSGGRGNRLHYEFNWRLVSFGSNASKSTKYSTRSASQPKVTQKAPCEDASSEAGGSRKIVTSENVKPVTSYKYEPKNINHSIDLKEIEKGAHWLVEPWDNWLSVKGYPSLGSLQTGKHYRKDVYLAPSRLPPSSDDELLTLDCKIYFDSFSKKIY